MTRLGVLLGGNSVRRQQQIWREGLTVLRAQPGFALLVLCAIAGWQVARLAPPALSGVVRPVTVLLTVALYVWRSGQLAGVRAEMRAARVALLSGAVASPASRGASMLRRLLRSLLRVPPEAG